MDKKMKDMTIAPEASEDHDSDCEDPKDDVEASEELGAEFEKEANIKGAEESEEPSNLGDLPDGTATEDAEDQSGEPVSPSNRLNWAAISEFSELEELPMGPIRPRPKLKESPNSSRRPSAEAIPEDQEAIETS